MKKWLSGPMAACLVLSVAGCASTPGPVRTEVQRVTPPEALYPTCATPPVAMSTNGELVRSLADTLRRLEQCRSGMQRVKAWGREGG